MVLTWVGGIVLAAHQEVPWGAWLAVTCLFLAVWFVTHTVSSRIGKMVLYLAVFSLATALSAWQLRPITSADVRYLPPGGVTVVGYALAPGVQSAYQWRTTFRVRAYRHGAVWQSVNSDVYIYGQGDPPMPGTMYELLAKVQPAQAAGNPFEFTWQAYLQQHALAYRMVVYDTHQLAHPAPTPWLSTLRARCSAALRRTMPGTYNHLHAQVLECLVLGVYGAPLPQELLEQFRRAGILHLMVVSGSQISLFAGLLLIPLGYLPLGRARTSYPRIRMLLLSISLLLLGAYVSIADRGPSVDRALLMILLAALSIFCALSPLGIRRSYRPDGITLLAMAALVILLCNPAMLFNPGMQLSFMAMFGLWTITPVLLRMWHRWPHVIALALAGTLGAQLMTYPVLAWHFGTIPILAPLTNLLAIPLVGILLPTGILAIVLSLVFPNIAVVLNWINLPLIKALLSISALAASLPWGQLQYYLHSPLVVLCYYATLGIGTLFLSRWLDSRDEGWDIPAGREPQMW